VGFQSNLPVVPEIALLRLLNCATLIRATVKADGDTGRCGMLDRRGFLAGLAFAGLGGGHLARANAQRAIGFGFSLYGMRTLTVEQGLKACAEIGYSGVELPVMPDWPCAAATLTPQRRREIRQQLQDLSLDLPALMENLPILATGTAAEDNLHRLKLAAELAHDLKPDTRVPVIETVLGGKPSEWDAVKNQFVDTLGRWNDVMQTGGVTLAIKAHVSNALHLPEDVVWLVEQIKSPTLRAAYDYSHFQRQGLSMLESLRVLLPYTVFVHVKDNITHNDKTEFALPGDAGNIDYTRMIQELRIGNYQGAVVVEVSGQVFSKPGYEPIPAARHCYQKLQSAFHRTGQRANI